MYDLCITQEQDIYKLFAFTFPLVTSIRNVIYKTFIISNYFQTTSKQIIQTKHSLYFLLSSKKKQSKFPLQSFYEFYIIFNDNLHLNYIT